MSEMEVKEIRWEGQDCHVTTLDGEKFVLKNACLINYSMGIPDDMKQEDYEFVGKVIKDEDEVI